MAEAGSPRRSPRRAARAWGRRLLAGLGLAALLSGAAIAGLWLWSHQGGARGSQVSLVVPARARVGQIGAELERRGLLRHPAAFEAYAVLTGGAARLKPGPHLLRHGLSPAELLARLTRSAARPVVKLTIPEGFNRFQIAERLEVLEVATAQTFLEASSHAPRLAELGVPGTTAEGYLFPATYELFVDGDPDQVLSTLVRETKKRFQRLAARHPGRLEELQQREGWGEHEALTLASIVEKEAADHREHGNIASVFFNRLSDAGFLPRRMLQSDVTAAYGCLLARATIESCRDYMGVVTPAMLRDAGNPYNTYKHPGLPPGPIGNPGESAISAVLDPPQTPYFFFVAGASKRHVFSRTLSEHEQAIATGMPAARSDTPRDQASSTSGDLREPSLD